MRVLSGRALPLRWGEPLSRGSGESGYYVYSANAPISLPGNRACAHGAISILTNCSGRNSAPQRHDTRILFFCTVLCVAATTLSCPRTSQPGTALPCCPRSLFTVRTKTYASDPKILVTVTATRGAGGNMPGLIVPKSKKIRTPRSHESRRFPAIRRIGQWRYACTIMRLMPCRHEHSSATNFFLLPIVGTMESVL
jgi:hypothetical protein